MDLFHDDQMKLLHCKNLPVFIAVEKKIYNVHLDLMSLSLQCSLFTFPVLLILKACLLTWELHD